MKVTVSHISTPNAIEVIPNLLISVVKGNVGSDMMRGMCVTVLIGWLTENIQINFEWKKREPDIKFNDYNDNLDNINFGT